MPNVEVTFHQSGQFPTVGYVLHLRGVGGKRAALIPITQEEEQVLAKIGLHQSTELEGNIPSLLKLIELIGGYPKFFYFGSEDGKVITTVKLRLRQTIESLSFMVGPGRTLNFTLSPEEALLKFSAGVGACLSLRFLQPPMLIDQGLLFFEEPLDLWHLPPVEKRDGVFASIKLAVPAS